MVVATLLQSITCMNWVSFRAEGVVFPVFDSCLLVVVFPLRAQTNSDQSHPPSPDIQPGSGATHLRCYTLPANSSVSAGPAPQHRNQSPRPRCCWSESMC